MSEITPFVFPSTGQSVRTLLVDGEPWFVAKGLTELHRRLGGSADSALLLAEAVSL